MKCPYLKCVRKYDDYHQTDESGYPIEVREETFGECVGEECPFWGSFGAISDVPRCYRAESEGN